MQSIAPTTPWHFPAGKFIDNDDFVFFNDVLDVLVGNAVGAEQIRNVVNSLRLLVTVLLSFRFLLSFSSSDNVVSKSISVNSLIKSGNTNAFGSSGFRNVRPCSERSASFDFSSMVKKSSSLSWNNSSLRVSV